MCKQKRKTMATLGYEPKLIGTLTCDFSYVRKSWSTMGCGCTFSPEMVEK